MNINDKLRELLSTVVIAGVRNPRTGKRIEFNLARNENKYLYFKSGSKHLCYTPHPDLDGWYYSWVYQPVGKGARTGKASHWKLTKLVAHRKR
jgi:hypothetical protein